MNDKKLAKKDLDLALSNLKKAGVKFKADLNDTDPILKYTKDSHDVAEQVIKKAYANSNFPSQFPPVKHIPKSISQFIRGLDSRSTQHLIANLAASTVHGASKLIKKLEEASPLDRQAVIEKIISDKNLSPEQMEELIASALRLSLGPTMDIKDRGGFTNQTGKIGATVKKAAYEDYYPVLDKVVLDDERSIAVRRGHGDSILYTADKGDDIISSLTVDPTGHIGYVSSGKRGIFEEATPRLVVEAVKRGQVPHSSNLLGPGQRFVQRMANEFKSSNFKELLKKFKDTGKLGKYWSMAAPILKVGLPLAGAYSSYSEAKEEGLPTPLAIAYAGAEEINPLPISGIDYVKGMEKAAEGRRAGMEKNFMPEELKMEKKALEAYEKSPAYKHRKWARIKKLLDPE